MAFAQAFEFASIGACRVERFQSVFPHIRLLREEFLQHQLGWVVIWTCVVQETSRPRGQIYIFLSFSILYFEDLVKAQENVERRVFDSDGNRSDFMRRDGEGQFEYRRTSGEMANV